MTAKDNEGNKGEVTNITKMTIYCRVYKCGVKFVVVVFVSSARWDDVGSRYCQVVDVCSGTIVAGS